MSCGALALLCLATADGMASPTRTFHQRPLPAPAVAFSSEEGQRLFAEALAPGSQASDARQWCRGVISMAQGALLFVWWR